MTERSPEPKRSASSGQHPAVKAYRKKLKSIGEGCGAAASELDHKLQEFLNDLRTPVPSVPPEDEEKKSS